MKYLLIVLIFIFISCGEEEVLEPVLCQNGYCHTECKNDTLLRDIYYKDEILVKLCLKSCSTNFTFIKDKYGQDDNDCTLYMEESNNRCEVYSPAGQWCENGFLNMDEE